MSMNELLSARIAVTGLNAGDSPAPGVAVIRCLREHPGWTGKIIGLSYDALESGVLDPRMTDSAYILPYPSAGKDALLERITSIHAREHIDVIIPNLDSELPGFIAIREQLSQLGIRLFLPTERQFKLRSKMSLPEFSKATGIPSPNTRVLTGNEPFTLSQKELPVVIKGPFYEAHLAYTKESAQQFVHKLAATWGYPVLLQELIPGEEYNVAALGDGEGGIVGMASMKKLVLTDKRKGWACVTISNPAIVRFAESIVRELKWKGPIEIEAIQSKKDGRFYIIELNPRFPAWIYLATAAGVNLPFALVQLAFGQAPAQLEPARPGVVFTNYTTNLVTDLSAISSLFTTGELHYENRL